MRRFALPSILSLGLILAVSNTTGAAPAPRGLKNFVRQAKPIQAQQHYAFGKLRVPSAIAWGLGKLGLGSQVRTRKLVQVTNQTLSSYTRATAKGYLEVVVPANKGHVFFRHGNKVFDFYPGGLRIGGVRQIKSDRYGMLVKLTATQEKKVVKYLRRLERTDGRELGEYDFHGEKGFHCVTWFMRNALGRSQGDNLVKLLQGQPRDGTSMPRFARFMLKKAKGLGGATAKGTGVAAVVVYKAQAQTASQLGKLKFELMSSRQLRRANREMQQ